MPVASQSDVVGRIYCNLNLLDGLIPHNVTICNHFAILQILVPMPLLCSVLHQFLILSWIKNTIQAGASICSGLAREQLYLCGDPVITETALAGSLCARI